jgi:hypothetical protein
MSAEDADSTWLRQVKQLAKRLSRRFAISLSAAQTATSRALGYDSFMDLRAAALDTYPCPEGLPSSGVWHMRLRAEFGSDVDELIAPEEVEMWAYRLALKSDSVQRRPG